MRPRVAAVAALALGAAGAAVAAWALLSARGAREDPAPVEAPAVPREDAPALATGGRAPAAPAARTGTCSVAGRVTRAGAPAAAAVEVRLSRAALPGVPLDWLPFEEGTRLVATASSAADGAFAVEGLGAGAYVLVARGRDGGVGTRWVELEVEGVLGDVRITLRGGPEVLRGRMRLRDGTPWRGRVSADDGDLGEDARSWFETDAEGRFEVPGLERGPATVRAREEHMRLSFAPVDVPAAEPVEIVVDLGLDDVEGRVVDAGSGAPVAGAEVRVESSASGLLDRAADSRTTTSPDGRFRARSYAGGEASTRATGYAEGWGSHRTGVPLVIAVEPLGGVRGRVVSAEDGAPVAGTRVYVLTHGGGAASPRPTDEQGRFALDGVVRGEAVVVVLGGGWCSPGLAEVDPEGFNPLALRVEPSRTTTIELRAARAASARGRVVEADGSPVGGASVRWTLETEESRIDVDALADASAGSTASDGTFALDTVPPDADVRLVAKAGEARGAAGPFLTAPDTRVEAEIRLDARRHVVVTTIDERTRAPVAATVWAYVRGGDGWLEPLETGASGVLRLGPVAATALYVGARGPGHRWTAAEVPAAEGAGDAALTLALPPALTISGVVRRPDGEAAAGATVQAKAQKGDDDETVTAGPDGTFRFGGVLPGTYELAVSPARRTHAFGPPVTVDAPADGVALVTGAGSEEEWVVRVVGADGSPVPNAAVAWKGEEDGSDDETLEGGVARLPVPTSPVHLLVWSPHSASGKPLPWGPRVAGPFEPGTRETEVRLPPERRIEGVVLGPDREPVAGVLVVARAVAAPEPFGSSDEMAVRARTDERGRFSIGSLAEGAYALSILAPPEIAPPQAVEVQAGSSVEVLLERGLSLPVTVLDPEGRPVPRASVTLKDAEDEDLTSARTNAQGVARLMRLRPFKAAALHVYAPGDDFLHHVVRYWSPGPTTVRLVAALSIAGRVVDGGGDPVPGADVFARQGDQGESRGEAGSDGSFVLRGLAAGEAVLRAVVDDDVYRESVPLRVAAGARNVTVVLQGTQSLVVRLDGWPRGLEQASVVLRDPESEDVRDQSVEEPVATFPVRRDARVDLYAVAADGALCALARGVRGDAGEVRLSLVPGRTISGRLTAPPGARAPEASIAGGFPPVEAEVDEHGAYVLRGVPEGRFRVHATAAGEVAAFEAEGEVEAGGRLDLELVRAP